MKKRTKIAVVLASLCIILGIVLSGCMLMFIDFDLSHLSTVRFESKTYEVKESFSNLAIQAGEYDVRLTSTQDSTCKVICTEGDNTHHTVTVDGDTLNITRTVEKAWNDYIGIYWGDEAELSITISLPEQEYDQLFIQTLSGNISVPDDFAFSHTELHSTSGDILFLANTNGTLSVQTTSGDLSIQHLAAEEIRLLSTSGDIEISNVTTNSIQSDSTSGDVAVRSVETTRDLLVKTTSGEIDFSDVRAGMRMELGSVSGEIELERCDASELLLNSVSGDITGSLRSEKRFITDTTSGDVKVPNTASPNAGTCTVTTTSGDIHFIILS